MVLAANVLAANFVLANEIPIPTPKPLESLNCLDVSNYFIGEMELTFQKKLIFDIVEHVSFKNTPKKMAFMLRKLIKAKGWPPFVFDEVYFIRVENTQEMDEKKKMIYVMTFFKNSCLANAIRIDEEFLKESIGQLV